MMIVTKALGLVEMVETENPHGEFDVILSATTLDRDGEIIDSRAFDPLPDHVPFDIDHGMTVQTTIGSGAPYYAEDGNLHVKGTFASTSLAQEVRTLVSEGHIRTTSVTFMTADRESDEKGVTHVRTAELLNGTFTPVPSNREAVVLSAKAVTAALDEKVGARNSGGDAEKIQSIHDTAMSLGASCEGAAKSVKAAEPLTGEPVEADVMEIVTPDADADRETDDVLKSADRAADVAAKAAASAAESADDGSANLARWDEDKPAAAKAFAD